jgi:hypothetical protein
MLVSDYKLDEMEISMMQLIEENKKLIRSATKQENEVFSSLTGASKKFMFWFLL